MYDIDSGVIWTDSLTDRGLAIMSGDLVLQSRVL